MDTFAADLALAVSVLGLAAVALWIGYLAYQTRVARLNAPPPPPPGFDPVQQLRDANVEIGAQLAQARGRLEQARDTLKKGIRG